MRKPPPKPHQPGSPYFPSREPVKPARPPLAAAPRKIPYLSASPLTRPKTVTQFGATRTYQPGDYLIILRDGQIIWRSKQDYERWFSKRHPLPPAKIGRQTSKTEPDALPDVGAGI